MLEGIKNIIFDLGGVILNIDYDLTSKAFKERGFDDFDAFYSQAKQSSLFDDFETGKTTVDQFCTKVTGISGVSKTGVVASWNAMLLDLPSERIELLIHLKDNYRIFLLSNTNEIHLNSFRANLIQKFGSDILEDIFEKVYYSHKLGLRKPNKDCFETVINLNDLIASETLFIDDSAQHVQGAQLAGLKSTLLNKGVQITSLFPDKVL